MKTAVAMPDPIFEAAEVLAGRLGMSRSQLYAKAVETFVDTASSPPVDPAVATGSPADPRRDAARLVEEQYRLARQYPGEYVVLIGERVVSHSPDRQEAFRAYDQAFLDFPGRDPVIVEPGSSPKRPPIMRGRSLTRSLHGRR